MPIHKQNVPPGSRLIKPTWDELGGTRGISLDLGVYQFYPTHAVILAPLRIALSGVLFRLFKSEDEEPSVNPQLLPRAIWPHTMLGDELLEAQLALESPAGEPWRSFLTKVCTLTLPRVYPWLRNEQQVEPRLHGSDIREGVELLEKIGPKGDTRNGTMGT